LRVGLLFGVIVGLEFVTAPEYVFGYLYAVPILLASNQLTDRETYTLTTAAVVFTLLNLVIPEPHLTSIAVVDRLITTAALVTVGLLSVRYRQAQVQLQRQELELRAQQQLMKVREDFIATLTHDLKTPLLGMNQTVRFFREGQFDPPTPEQTRVLHILGQSVAKLLNLTEMLLVIYRNETLGLTLQRQPVDLDELLADVVTELFSLAQERQVELVYDGLPNAVLSADPLQVSRVATNLIANAIHHTALGSPVQIQLVHGVQEYRVLVSDHGAGIPRTELRRVFDRFYQSPTTRQVTGTGLGLYLSRQIVTAHGGRIWGANRPEGGCTFAFTLPMETSDVPAR